MSELDASVAYPVKEPLGVVGSILPWNFSLSMAEWNPARAAGNGAVLEPAEQTPATILLFAELVAGILPRGVLNIVNGFGVEAGKPLAHNRRVANLAFIYPAFLDHAVSRCRPIEAGDPLDTSPRIRRETQRLMLDHHQQTENIQVSHDQKPMGFF